MSLYSIGYVISAEYISWISVTTKNGIKSGVAPKKMVEKPFEHFLDQAINGAMIVLVSSNRSIFVWKRFLRIWKPSGLLSGLSAV